MDLLGGDTDLLPVRHASARPGTVADDMTPGLTEYEIIEHAGQRRLRGRSGAAS